MPLTPSLSPHRAGEAGSGERVIYFGGCYPGRRRRWPGQSPWATSAIAGDVRDRVSCTAGEVDFRPVGQGFGGGRLGDGKNGVKTRQHFCDIFLGAKMRGIFAALGMGARVFAGIFGVEIGPEKVGV